MGSGLILLVIVGAWLAVLVPMALRSHDSATSLSSVERFGDAMRVLSRRVPVRDPSRTVLMPRPPGRQGPAAGMQRAGSAGAARPAVGRPALDREIPDAGRPWWADSGAPVGRLRVAGRARFIGRLRGHRAAERAPLSLAARRRRTLLALLVLAALTLGLGLLGPAWLLFVSGTFALLAVAFVAHCRRQAVLKSRRVDRARPPVDASSRSYAPPAEAIGSESRLRRRPAVHIAGVPDRMPAPPAPLSAPLPAPAPAARYEDPYPVAAAGASWSPVPVPVPTYVTAPVAPPRPRRVLDLTNPGKWSAGQDGEDELAGLADDGELDDILTRRRAVNDW